MFESLHLMVPLLLLALSLTVLALLWPALPLAMGQLERDLRALGTAVAGGLRRRITSTR